MIDGHQATLLELLEVRLALECNAALLAARRATPLDVAALEKTYQDMVNRTQEGSKGIPDDVAFHMAIAFATKNPVQLHIMKNLHDLVHFGIKESLAHLWERPARIELIHAQHREVLEAIRRHDEQAAFEAMRRHINFVIQETVEGAVSQGREA